MKISTKARYAVMALLDMLADNSHAPVSLTTISERQNLPLPYLEQIFLRLRKGGIVESVRGAQGGYVFARPPEHIMIYDVFLSVDSTLKAKRCSNPTRGCQPGGTRCMTHDLWACLDDVVAGFFKSVSLSHIVNHDLQKMLVSISMPPYTSLDETKVA